MGAVNKQSLNTYPELFKYKSIFDIRVPAGFTNDRATDYWLHMSFDFCGKKADVKVTSWFITDSSGVETSLSKLSYDEVQFLSQAMLAQFESHKRNYYDQLEADYYSLHPKDEYD